jgi:UDP:flavonoid glycosyltransferase YjiC (YdhE family)
MSGHVRPMLPVVRQLVDAGHEVLWYTANEFTELVTGAGARFVPMSDSVGYRGALRRSAGRGGVLGLNRMVLEFFIKPVPAYVADLRPVFDEFQPSLVVTDSSFRAAVFLAEQRNVPRAAFSFGPLNLSSVDTPPFGFGLRPAAGGWWRLRDRMLSWALRRVVCRQAQRVACDVRESMNLRPLDGFFIDWVAQVADRYVQSGVPDYEYPRSDLPDSVVFVGPLFAEGGNSDPLPDWWPDLAAARSAGRPVVLITQGTVATDPANLVRPAIAALADSEALLVAITSGREPADVLPVEQRPDNLRLAKFIPYPAVLPYADVMVTNGGYGGVQQGLAHGVPIVACGTSEDKGEVSARVVWSGAGISLKTNRTSPRDVRQAVDRVLTDPAYTVRARQIAEAHQNYGGAKDAVAAILGLLSLDPVIMPEAGSKSPGPVR